MKKPPFSWERKQGSSSLSLPALLLLLLLVLLLRRCGRCASPQKQ